jgi:hypothetical protein
MYHWRTLQCARLIFDIISIWNSLTIIYFETYFFLVSKFTTKTFAGTVSHEFVGLQKLVRLSKLKAFFQVRRNKLRTIPHFGYSPDDKMTFARVTFSETCPIKWPQEWTYRTVEELKEDAKCSSSDGKYNLCYFILVVLQLTSGIDGRW